MLHLILTIKIVGYDNNIDNEMGVTFKNSRIY